MLGSLPPACAGIMLLLITGGTNKARYFYFITWVLRYVLVFITILIFAIFFDIQLITKDICGEIMDVPSSTIDVNINSEAWEECQNISGLLGACWIIFTLMGLHYILVLN